MNISKKAYEYWAESFNRHIGSYIVKMVERRQKREVHNFVINNRKDVANYLQSEEADRKYLENYSAKIIEIAGKLSLTPGEVERNFPKNIEEYRHIVDTA